MIPSLFSNRRGTGSFDPFSLDVWDPFSEFSFPSSSFANSFLGETLTFVNTWIDRKGTPEVHVFKEDLVGIKKEEVKVEVEDNIVLQISGERSKEEAEEKNDKWHRVERRNGKFVRRFRPPENMTMDGVNQNGECSFNCYSFQGGETELKLKSTDISG